MAPMNSEKQVKETLIGGAFVLMCWFLAFFTTLTGNAPPFLLAALSFGIATTLIVIRWLVRKENIKLHLKQPIGAWLVGVCGLFGYHLFYFLALRNTPPVEASLIAYMWKLLIALFSALLPGEKLSWWHVIGASLLVTGGNGLSDFKTEYTLG